MHKVVRKGVSISEAKKAIIMIHGRGATAESILGISSYLNLTDYAILAPQANGNSWYPFGFMKSDSGNFVALESSLKQIQSLFNEVLREGLAPENVFFVGFSQGACLSLEFAARNAQKLGGIVAFTGGLVGEKLKAENYSGDFQGTPIFIGSSDRDFHVPAIRIQESADLLRQMGAEVTVKLFEDPEHTIREEEIEWVNQYIFV